MIPANEFVITVATSNGSGSQSSNNILVRTLFRMGIPVGGKNLFPSNIQGLPTWFTIRANDQGFTGRKKLADVVVAMNPATAIEDLSLARPKGFVFLNSEVKLPEAAWRKDVTTVVVPFKEIVTKISDSVKLRKLLVNMAYVGVLAELLRIPQDILDETIEYQFGDKASVIESNRQAILAGRAYAQEKLADLSFPFRAESRNDYNNGKILIDGNSAAAMGLLFSGCSFISWYPITPSSSLVENFAEMAELHRKDKDGKKNYAIVQAEDELASISMVLGAGWSGARAMTATSGPGLSLMAEAAGLAYYAEIPAVIWDVQRVGPSTGLPTRTMQGDLLKAYYLSHGDAKHVVLLPGSPTECFEFAQTAFDLAESLQTLVIVLSELDTGMNLHCVPRFQYPTQEFLRGKVLSADDLEKIGKFQRYKDIDGDGIPYRTLPGTEHKLAAYFTRGTGHDESGLYSEKPEVYKANVDRLTRKFQTASTMVPEPTIDSRASAKVGIITYGSSHEAVCEAKLMLQNSGTETNYLRLRALPFTSHIEEFLDSNDRVYIVEQNRDAQLMSILRSEYPQYWGKCRSILHYDGMPLDAEGVFDKIHDLEKERTCR